MKHLMKLFTSVICAIILIFSSASIAFAHSGRTDSSGGHKDNKNKSGLGNYHYHCGGHPAHLHTKGHCPYKEPFPKSINVSADKTTIKPGESVTLITTVLPNDASDDDITWESSDSSVASVSNGLVTGKNPGTTTITAETFNEKKAVISITVLQTPTEKDDEPSVENNANAKINESSADNEGEDGSAAAAVLGVAGATGVGVLTVKAIKKGKKK